MRLSNNMSWTGDAEMLVIWDGSKTPVRALNPGDEFKLFGWRWRVRRQATRTTFADGTGEWKGCSLQLKHSRLVEVPVVVHAEHSTGGEHDNG